LISGTSQPFYPWEGIAGTNWAGEGVDPVIVLTDWRRQKLAHPELDILSNLKASRLKYSQY